jgi:hypothetical protein
MASLERYEARNLAQVGTFNPNLAHLIDEHNDLDLVISVLLSAGDDLLINRLKKRKLHIKDEIACLRGETIAELMSSVA